MSREASAGPAQARFVEAVLNVQSLVSAGAPAGETYQAIIDQSMRLVELGCDLGQGYLLSRPLDAAAAGVLLVATV